MSGSSRSSARCSLIGAQINPDVWRTKNAIASGVANSAAMIRSPSFSRSSSSITTMISPRATAATAFSMSANGIALPLSSFRCQLAGFEQALDVLGDHVDLEVDTIAHPLATEGGHGGGVRDDGDGEAVVGRLHDGEAAAVDGDRPLLDDVAQEVGWHAHPEVGGRCDDLADGVDVALHDVATEPVAHPYRPFEVDDVAGLYVTEIRARQRLVHSV